MNLKRVKAADEYRKEQERMLTAVERNLNEILDYFSDFFNGGGKPFSRQTTFEIMAGYEDCWHPYECIAWYVRRYYRWRDDLLR